MVPPSPPLYFSSSPASLDTLSRGSCSFSTPLSTLQLVVVMLLTQSCLTLCDPTDCSPPDSSVHGILQERILKWVAMPSSRGSSRPRDGTRVSCHSCIAGGLFTTSATWEALFPSFFLFLKFTCSGHSGFYLESQLPSSFSCQVPSFSFLQPAYFREMTLI